MNVPRRSHGNLSSRADNSKQRRWSDSCTLMPSPPSSPGRTHCPSSHASQYRGSTQLPLHVGRQSKNGVGSTATKKAAGRVLPRTQHRCNSHRPAYANGDKDGGEDNENEGGGSDSEHRSGGGSRGAGPSKQLLACPFYKFNPLRYMSCVRLRLTRVRDVKQHLNRRHRRPMHCPTCGNIFEDSQLWDAHIRERTCVRPPDGFDVEGITESQVAALARRVNRSLDEASQWFSIWRILFIDSPQPESPYLSNHFEETLNTVYDYWQRHRHVLIAELADPSLSDAVVVELSSHIVDTILLRFRSRSRAVMDPSSSNPTTVESASRASASFIPSPDTISSCTTRLPSPPPPPSTLQRARHHPPQNKSSVGVNRSNTYTGASVASIHAPVVFPPRRSTPNSASPAEPILTQDASTYAIDTVGGSPYDGSVAAYNFSIPGEFVTPLGSVATLVQAGHIESPLENTLTHMGGWLSGIDVNPRPHLWAQQSSNISLTSPGEDVAYFDPTFTNTPEWSVMGNGQF